MRTRTILIVTAGLVGAGIGGAALVSAINDPEVGVDDVAVPEIELVESTPVATTTPARDDSGSSTPSQIASSGGSTPSADATPADDAAVIPSVEQVDGLEQLAGTLRVGEYGDDWYVLGVEVDFGPEQWVFSAPALGDYDGDGTAEPLLAELRGLEGQEVVFGVRYELDDDDRDDAYAYTINGLVYRDATGGPAPWHEADGSSSPAPSPAEQPSSDRPSSGGPVSADEASAIGAAATGGTAIDVWPGVEDGRNVFYVDVRTADGLAEVYVDAATGEVLTIESGD